MKKKDVTLYRISKTLPNGDLIFFETGRFLTQKQMDEINKKEKKQENNIEEVVITRKGKKISTQKEIDLPKKTSSRKIIADTNKEPKL